MQYSLQLTINSTKAVSFPTPFLATRVKILVSIQVAFSMMNVAISTDLSSNTSTVFKYHNAVDKGLLEICRVTSTLLLSFTT